VLLPVARRDEGQQRHGVVARDLPQQELMTQVLERLEGVRPRGRAVDLSETIVTTPSSAS
jgi:hypothetical protein